jgi:catechol 2,3-dioxygenase-like lactoylglutathione lyase family enzyme
LGATTLLIFQLGLTAEDHVTDKGVRLPGHGPSKDIIEALTEPKSSGTPQPALKQHFCFAVNSPDDISKWEARLEELGVSVTGRMEWERGGRSVYFSDPDGHVGEIASRGIWAHY